MSFRILRIRAYIKGWDQQFLFDPEENVAEKKIFQSKDKVQKIHKKLLDCKKVPMNTCTQSIDQVCTTNNAFGCGEFPKDKRQEALN